MLIISDKWGHGKEQDKTRRVKCIQRGICDAEKSIINLCAQNAKKEIPDRQGQCEERGLGSRGGAGWEAVHTERALA